MADNVTYAGQNENTGDTRAKYLKLFKGEVLAAFNAKNIGLDLVTVRTIRGGKSEQFIVTGTFSESDVATHVPGTDITTTALSTNERTITIADRVYISSFIDDLDEVLSQFEMRGVISKAQGAGLADKLDKAIFRGIYDTALVAPISGQTAAVSVTNTVIGTATTNEAKGDAILESVFDAQAALDANNVPSDGRVLVLSPADTYALVQSQKAVNRDFNGGDNGSISKGKVMEIAGLNVYQTNNLPTMTLDEIPVATNLTGMIFTPDVFGVLKAMDIQSDADKDPRKLGYLMTSYYAVGMGSLNPSCLAVIFKA